MTHVWGFHEQQVLQDLAKHGPCSPAQIEVDGYRLGRGRAFQILSNLRKKGWVERKYKDGFLVWYITKTGKGMIS
jgi:hypothetical protein